MLSYIVRWVPILLQILLWLWWFLHFWFDVFLFFFTSGRVCYIFLWPQYCFLPLKLVSNAFPYFREDFPFPSYLRSRFSFFIKKTIPRPWSGWLMNILLGGVRVSTKFCQAILALLLYRTCPVARFSFPPVFLVIFFHDFFVCVRWVDICCVPF